ncbi:patatin-like phospholipase family protein [Pyxidicoccus sp. MSG2]|uniref:patatin-like phospholipase family protein n=1 Tax=Pyxidicoccus sp. MSG2 TaxID=2996790 RepID=UPI002271BAD0|nr:patatin-like phospholipase family protein [Pyxidicoccus sp. MSG2]MCY1022297.1 patatin-like phospholipase family protein [Pyxidicoccus sp. MSG2]
MNILSFDGAASTSLQIRMLKYLELEVPGFLERAELFAGASDGTLLGVYLASRLHGPNRMKPLAAIDDAIEFSNEMAASLHASLWGTLMATIGISPLLSPGLFSTETKFQKLVEQRFGNETLRDLTKSDVKVVIASFNMTEKRPQIFQNFGPTAAAPEFLLSELALASSAMPLMLPLPGFFGPGHPKERSYYLDGSLATNNPSMSAVAAAVNSLCLNHGVPRLRHHIGGHPIETVVVASLGSTVTRRESKRDGPLNGGMEQVHIPRPTGMLILKALSKLVPKGRHVKSLDWGWLQWLLNYEFNLIDLGLYAWFQNAMDTVALQCSDLLHPDQYCRYAPGIDQLHLLLQLLFGDTQNLLDTMDKEALRLREGPGFRHLVDWARKEWMQAPLVGAKPDLRIAAEG